MSTPEQLLLTEDKFIPPLIEILDSSTSQPEYNPPQVHDNPDVKAILDKLFPEQEYEEKTIQMAKEILGDIAKEYSLEELKCAIVEIQYLIDTWLDDFERKIFKGLTLKELLHEKGGV